MKTTTKVMAWVLPLAMVALPLGVATANHVKIDGTVEVPAAPPAGVVVVPSNPVVAPQTLQANDIEAHQVRAQTIYANRIEADQVQGLVHQSKGVKIKDSHGNIKAPEVTASIIYADEIKANSVIADNIFVRDMRRR